MIHTGRLCELILYMKKTFYRRAYAASVASQRHLDSVAAVSHFQNMCRWQVQCKPARLKVDATWWQSYRFHFFRLRTSTATGGEYTGVSNLVDPFRPFSFSWFLHWIELKCIKFERVSQVGDLLQYTLWFDMFKFKSETQNMSQCPPETHL